MNQREKLEAEAIAYKRGYADALRIVQAERDTRRWEAYDTGYQHGQNAAHARTRKIEWSKLFGVVVAGSVIGCGMILAVAVGLSYA